MPRSGGLNNKHLFLTVLEAEVQDQGASTVGFFVEDALPGCSPSGLSLVLGGGGGGGEGEEREISSLFLFL